MTLAQETLVECQDKRTAEIQLPLLLQANRFEYKIPSVVHVASLNHSLT